MTDPIPARVLALAKQINDEPIAWNEREDGSIVIVFCNKGKRTFYPEDETAAPARAEEQEAEQRTPAPDPVTVKTPKRKEKK